LSTYSTERGERELLVPVLLDVVEAEGKDLDKDLKQDFGPIVFRLG